MNLTALLRASQAFDHVLEIIHLEFPDLFEKNDVKKIYVMARETINPEIIAPLAEEKIFPLFTLSYEAFLGCYPRRSYKQPD